MKRTLTAVLLAAIFIPVFPFPAPAQKAETITFRDSDVEVPPVVKKEIGTFVKLVFVNQNMVLTSLQAALNNFDTTMSYASAKEADPDMFGAMVSETFSQSIELICKGLDPSGVLVSIKKIAFATAKELGQAGRTAQSFQVGEWIKSQRSAIDRQMRSFNTLASREQMEADLELAYLEQDVDGRDEFFDQLYKATRALKGPVGPSIDDLELKLYEKWINSHFRKYGDPTPGTIDYRLNVVDNYLTFKTCHVITPFGDKVESAVNLLLNSGRLTSAKSPADLRVRKQVCLYSPNIVGGWSWDCGVLDKDSNTILRDASFPGGRRVMREWALNSATRFTDK